MFLIIALDVILDGKVSSERRPQELEARECDVGVEERFYTCSRVRGVPGRLHYAAPGAVQEQQQVGEAGDTEQN